MRASLSHPTIIGRVRNRTCPPTGEAECSAGALVLVHLEALDEASSEDDSEAVTGEFVPDDERTMVEVPWHSVRTNRIGSKIDQPSVAGEIDADRRKGFANLVAAADRRGSVVRAPTHSATSEEYPTVRSPLLDFFATGSTAGEDDPRPNPAVDAKHAPMRAAAAPSRGERNRRAPGLGPPASDGVVAGERIRGTSLLVSGSGPMVPVRATEVVGRESAGFMNPSMPSRSCSSAAAPPALVVSELLDGPPWFVNDGSGSVVEDSTARTRKVLLLVGSLIVLAIASFIVTMSVLGEASAAPAAGAVHSLRHSPSR